MLRQLFDRANRERGSAGFTLIELLIVVVIIGILAAIAIPQFSSTKEKAYVASMKSDLRNLATSQEAYFAENNTYAGAVGDLTDYSASESVTITMDTGTQTGWSATASHPAVSNGDTYCGIAFGSASFPSLAAGSPGSTATGAPYCVE